MLVDRPVGPFTVSVWGDPDVGTGTFYVVVEPAAGRVLPADLAVGVGTRPVSGRLPEAVYPAKRQPGQVPAQWVAELLGTELRRFGGERA